MKRAAQMLLIAGVMSTVLVGADRKGSFDLSAKHPVIVVAEKKGSFDITEKKGSFDITEKKGSFDITEKKGSFDTEGKDPEVPVSPN